MSLLLCCAPVNAANDSSASVFYLSGDGFSSRSLHLDSTLDQQWLLGLGVAEDRETALGEPYAATSVSVALQSMLESPWQFGMDVSRWRGQDTVRADTFRLQVDYLFERVSAGIRWSSRDMTLTARSLDQGLLTREISADGYGLDLRWFVTDRIDVGARYTRFSYSRDLGFLNLQLRPVLLQILSFHTFGLINSLAEDDQVVDIYYTAERWRLGAYAAATRSAVDTAQTRAWAVLLDWFIRENLTLQLESGAQSTESSDWSSQFGIGARFSW
ncbi:MAG: hypothetical protein KTR32_31990 [Granulosicoccus sp.]|nr:hypothetical protein [Granulosicoccus sp.]